MEEENQNIHVPKYKTKWIIITKILQLFKRRKNQIGVSCELLQVTDNNSESQTEKEGSSENLNKSKNWNFFWRFIYRITKWRGNKDQVMKYEENYEATADEEKEMKQKNWGIIKRFLYAFKFKKLNKNQSDSNCEKVSSNGGSKVTINVEDADANEFKKPKPKYMKILTAFILAFRKKKKKLYDSEAFLGKTKKNWKILTIMLYAFKKQGERTPYEKRRFAIRNWGILRNYVKTEYKKERERLKIKQAEALIEKHGKIKLTFKDYVRRRIILNIRKENHSKRRILSFKELGTLHKIAGRLSRVPREPKYLGRIEDHAVTQNGKISFKRLVKLNNVLRILVVEAKAHKIKNPIPLIDDNTTEQEELESRISETDEEINQIFLGKPRKESEEKKLADEKKVKDKEKEIKVKTEENLTYIKPKNKIKESKTQNEDKGKEGEIETVTEADLKAAEAAKKKAIIDERIAKVMRESESNKSRFRSPISFIRRIGQRTGIIQNWRIRGRYRRIKNEIKVTEAIIKESRQIGDKSEMELLDLIPNSLMYLPESDVSSSVIDMMRACRFNPPMIVQQLLASLCMLKGIQPIVIYGGPRSQVIGLNYWDPSKKLLAANFKMELQEMKKSGGITRSGLEEFNDLIKSCPIFTREKIQYAFQPAIEMYDWIMKMEKYGYQSIVVKEKQDIRAIAELTIFKAKLTLDSLRRQKTRLEKQYNLG